MEALKVRAQGRTIAFVPTMGALHQGHLSIIDLAHTYADIVVVSIYVNPTQFGPNEDFAKYPRPIKKDTTLCQSRKVGILFNPKTLYVPDHSTWVNEDAVGSGLCGGSRPGHFRGVTTIVAKLFNIVQPHTALFGQKDAQQCAVIERMVRDLNFPIKIVRAPIYREASGLAMSSRNVYLSEEERRQSLALSSALLQVKRSSIKTKAVRTLRKEAEGIISQAAPMARLDYIEFRQASSFEPLTSIVRGKTLVAVAAFFGKTRLIDNFIL